MITDYPIWFLQNCFLEFSYPDLSEYQGTTGTSQSHTNAFSHQHLPVCTGIGTHFLCIVVWGLMVCGSTLVCPIMHAQVT